MFEVFEYAKQQDKKIIITSDMYLNKNILENVLNLKGYNGIINLFSPINWFTGSVLNNLLLLFKLLSFLIFFVI